MMYLNVTGTRLGRGVNRANKTELIGRMEATVWEMEAAT